MHGLSGDLVAPDWPPLVLDELADVLPARRIRWTSPRPLSAAALVETGDGTVFVKRHDVRVRDLAGLAEEHAFAAHLRAAGAPVPEVLGAVQRGSWTYELHAVGDGADRYRDVLSWEPFARRRRRPGGGRGAGPAEHLRGGLRRTGPAAAGAGRRLAGRHGGAGCGRTSRRARTSAPRSGPGWPRWRTSSGRCRTGCHRCCPRWRAGWTHGDGHASNLLWTGAAVTAVLDLGLCDRTTPVFDLATAIERNAVSWLADEPAADLALVDALVDGWQAERPLTEGSGRRCPSCCRWCTSTSRCPSWPTTRGSSARPRTRRWPWTATCSATPGGRTSPAGTALLDHLRRRA